MGVLRLSELGDIECSQFKTLFNYGGVLPNPPALVTPLIATLVSLMALNNDKLTKTFVPAPPGSPLSRQQRRYQAAHPNAPKQPGPISYHTLALNLDATSDGNGGSHKGGWEQAFHSVRSHVRRYKRTGKEVVVKAHSKGNPFKDIITKDYDLKGKVAV